MNMNKIAGDGEKQATTTIQNQQMKLDLNMERFGILLVDEINGYDVPLLDFQLPEVKLDFKMIDVQMKEKFHSKIRVDYYNLRIGEWEPILEEYECDVVFKQIQSFEDPSIISKTISYCSPSPLNINVTQAMVETVMITSSAWKNGFSSSEGGEGGGEDDSQIAITSFSFSSSGAMISTSEFHPFLLKNQTAWDISFYKNHRRDQGYTFVPNGKSVEFGFEEHKYSSNKV